MRRAARPRPSGLSHAGRVAAAALLLAGCATGPAPVTPTSVPGPFVAGYHPWWALGRGTERSPDGRAPVWADYPFDLLDRLYVFEIEVGADGGIRDLHGWPEAWRPLVLRAREAGVDVSLTITLHEEGGFEALFADQERITRLADRLVRLATAPPEVGGVHLDFEIFRPVPEEVRDGYTTFVRELDRRLDDAAPGVALSVFSLALDLDDAYDEEALADHVDYLVVQGYDLHHRTADRAGPLSAITGWSGFNLEAVLERYRALGVPSAKIVLALPLYGYEWPVVDPEAGAATRGEGIVVPLTDRADVLPESPTARERTSEHGVRRDLESGIPWYAFERADGWVQGWFDDPRSLAAKYRWVRAHGLGGVALFPLPYGDAAVWEGLRRAFPRRRGG